MKTSTSGHRSARKSGSAAKVPNEGDLIHVDFSPTIGTEQRGPRYGLVISERSYNGRVGRCFVCPTTGTPKGYPFEVVLPAGLPVHGAVLSDQGKPIDWRARNAVIVGTVPQTVLDDVRAKLKAFQGIP